MNLTRDMFPWDQLWEQIGKEPAMENNTEGFVVDDFILDSPLVRALLCIAYTVVFILCFFGICKRF